MSVRLVHFLDVDIAKGECAIMVGNIRERLTEKVVVDKKGKASWQRGKSTGSVKLAPEIFESFGAERDRVWEHESSFDFAPSQHTIAGWFWAVVIHDGDEIRTFQGNAYGDWATREPVCDIVDWMREFIDEQIDD